MVSKMFKKTKKGKLKKFKLIAKPITFGNIGLKSLEPGIITFWQLEAAKQTILKKLQKAGKLWVKVLPHLPITAKPTSAWMGKGKGSISHWSARVSAGTILFEVCCQNRSVGTYALMSGSQKLSVKTKIIY